MICGSFSATVEKGEGTSAGTLAWLIERYRETAAWTNLSLATRRQRENIFRHVLDSAGSQPFAKITTATVKAGRDRRSATPSQARHFLDAMRGLFRWAVDAQMAKLDPTAGVADPPRHKSDGFVVWTQEDIAAYEARWPIGTKERVWLDILIYTGLRRGDAVRLGRQHIRNGIATLKTEKNGNGGHTAHHTSAREHSCGGAVWRSDIYLWRAGQSADQRKFRQRVQASVQGLGFTPTLSAWSAKGCCNARS